MELIKIISSVSLLFIILVGLITRATMSYSKRVTIDWDEWNDLKTRCYEVLTKEEIEIIHKEFQEKMKILKYNNHISREAMRVDGYLRGLYKQYES